MADDGVQRSIAFFTSAFSSYSGCRQYREDIARAQEQVGPTAPEVDKLRVFFNHPGFVEPMTELSRSALATIDESRRTSAKVLFTAHSLPKAMAVNCRYETQLRETCQLIADSVGFDDWQLVYQSRSGPPTQPWLEPDVCDVIRETATNGNLHDVVIVPVGFTSDHMEVVFDLDTEAKQLCDELGVNMVRVPTVGVHPRFVAMIRELVIERTQRQSDRPGPGYARPEPRRVPHRLLPLFARASFAATTKLKCPVLLQDARSGIRVWR